MPLTLMSVVKRVKMGYFFLGLLLAFSGTSSSLPQGYLSPIPELQLEISRQGSSVTPSGIHLPENCTFLTNSQTTTGQTVEGEYSYKDPLGSTVTVQYTVGLDGEGYAEKRRFVKGQGSGNADVTTRLVSKIILELKPTIIRIIRATVQASNRVDLNPDTLAKTIIVQLRPVVLDAAEKALQTSTSKVRPTDLTDQILIEITPFVEEGVRTEVEASQTQQSTISLDVFVRKIIQELQNTVTAIIRAAVVGASAETTDFEALPGQIIIRLKPVVQSAVEKAMAGTRFEEDSQIRSDQVTEKILVELRPFVEKGVRREVQIVQSGQTDEFSEANLVATIIAKLKPTLINIIRTTVKSTSGVNLNNPEELIETIYVQLRPVVLAAVNGAKATASGIDVTDVTEKIVTQIRPFIAEGVKKEIGEVQQQSFGSEDQVVGYVIAQLKPTVIEIIRNVVGSSDVRNTNLESLVASILEQLEPVVLASVKSAIRNSGSNYDANVITTNIIIQLRPFVEEGVKNEVAQSRQITEGDVVRTITSDLRPTVVTIIRSTVSQESNLNNPEGLVETIIVQLRPVVVGSVTKASKQFDAEKLAERIIIELRPFILEAVQLQISEIQANAYPTKIDEDQLVKTVITQLKPTVIQVIRGVVETAQVNLENPDELVQTILVELQPVVLNAVENSLESNSGVDSGSLTTRILIEITPFVEEGVKREITSYKLDQKRPESDLVVQIITKLRPIIVQTVKSVYGNQDDQQILPTQAPASVSQEISFDGGRVEGEVQYDIEYEDEEVLASYNSGKKHQDKKILKLENGSPNELSSADEQLIITQIVDKFSSKVRSVTRSVVQESTLTSSDENLADLVVSQVKSEVFLEVQGSANTLGQSGWDRLTSLVMEKLRIFIIQEIQLIRNEFHRRQTVQEQEDPKSVASIFGVSGTNVVKVDTPAFNYGYQFGN